MRKEYKTNLLYLRMIEAMKQGKSILFTSVEIDSNKIKDCFKNLIKK